MPRAKGPERLGAFDAVVMVRDWAERPATHTRIAAQLSADEPAIEAMVQRFVAAMGFEELVRLIEALGPPEFGVSRVLARTIRAVRHEELQYQWRVRGGR